MTYREFEIDPHWYEGFVYAHEDYDGAPDANDPRCGSAKTIGEAKKAIDEYYFEKTSYRVVNERSITKFTFLEDAMTFINTFGGELETLVGHNKVEFDSL